MPLSFLSFPSWIIHVGGVFFAMVKKTMDLHVFPNLAFAFTIFGSFDLWMFKGDLNTFSLVINF